MAGIGREGSLRNDEARTLSRRHGWRRDHCDRLPRRPSRSRLTLLLAHGAGANQRHAYMVGTAERLSARGISVVTFDFPYTEQGKKLPDKNDVLEACFRDVFAAVRAKVDGALFTGGKSMGGRIASQVAAKGGIDPAGLVLLGYPLHPPGKPTQWRDKHLPEVKARCSSCRGRADALRPGDLAPRVQAGERDAALRRGGGGPTRTRC